MFKNSSSYIWVGGIVAYVSLLGGGSMVSNGYPYAALMVLIPIAFGGWLIYLGYKKWEKVWVVKPVDPVQKQKSRLQLAKFERIFLTFGRICLSFVMFSTGILVLWGGYYVYPRVLEAVDYALPFVNHSNAAIEWIGSQIVGFAPLVVLLCIVCWAVMFWVKAIQLWVNRGNEDE
jgi:hypothetical protein